MGLQQVVESTVVVDAGVWWLTQTAPPRDPTGSFAGSLPGQIMLSSGARDALAQVRVELWDERPPWQAGWEDRCELLYRADVEDTLLVPHGTSWPEALEGLDLTGWRHVRVVVLARGRYQVDRDAFPDERPVEHWLVQLYPDPVEGGTHPMDLEPLRVAQDPRVRDIGEVSPWDLALHASQRAGWSDAILGASSLVRLREGLRRLRRPATVQEILEVTSSDMSGSSPGASARLSQLAWGGAGRPLSTWDEHVNAYVALDILVIHDPETRAVLPHPAPRQAWDTPGIDPDELRRARRTAASRYLLLAEDIVGLLEWCPDGRLDVGVRQLATRLSAPVSAVEGALEHLETGRRITLVRHSGTGGSDVTVSLQQAL